MNLFSLYAELGLKDDGFKKGIGDAAKSGESFAGTIVNKVSAGTVALGNLMADAVKSAGGVIKDFASKGLDYNRTMEDYTINFKTLLGGSGEAAAQMVGALEDMAAKTPFAMEHLAGSTQTLLSFGVESDKVMGIMQMLGDVSMGNSEKFASLSRAFGQISAAGKLSGEDLNQLIDQGFNPLQTIAETTGASMADLKAVMAGQKTSKDFEKMVKDAREEVKKLGDNASDGAKWLVQMANDGVISADMVTEVFKTVTEEGGLFYNAMEESSKSTSGMLSTLEDNWTALLGSVFKPASEFLSSTLLPAAITAVDTLQNGFNENGFSGMLESVGTMIGDVGTKIVEALPGIIDSVKTWAEEKRAEIVTTATDMFNGFADSLPDVIAKVTEALPGILTAVTAWVVTSKISMGEQATELFAGISGAIPTVLSEISTALPDIVSTITDFVTAQAPVILEQAMSLFGGLSTAVADAISGITTSLPDVISGFVTTVTENLPQLLTLGGDMVGEIIKGVIGAIPQILTAALGFAVTMATEIGKYDWLSIGGDIIAGLLEGLKSAATTSLEAIKNAFVDIWDGIKEVFGINSPSTVAAEAGGFILEGFKDGIITGVSTFGETIKNAFKGIWDGIKSIFGFGKKDTSGEDAEGVGTSIVEGLATGLDGSGKGGPAEKAGTLAQNVLDALNTGFDIIEGISNKGVTIGSTVAGGIVKGTTETDVSGINIISSNVFLALIDAFSVVAGVSGTMVPIGEAVGKGIVDGVKNADYSGVQDSSNSIMSQLRKAMDISEGIAGTFTDVGEAIAKGIAKGIRDNENKIKEAARNAAKDAYDAAMDELDAHSPSRKMMEVGRYFAEGFALGIAGNSDMAAGAARGMTRQAMYGSFMGDMNITQNISAVPMSPNELAIQTMSAMQMLRFA